MLKLNWKKTSNPTAMRETLFHYFGFFILIVALVRIWTLDPASIFKSFGFVEKKVLNFQKIATLIVICIGAGIYSDLMKRKKY